MSVFDFILFKYYIFIFQWSERMKGKEDQIAELFLPRRKAMSVTPNIHLSDLLAAREDIAIIEKTSSASVRKNTQSSINKIIIGRVIDLIIIQYIFNNNNNNIYSRTFTEVNVTTGFT